MSNVSVSARTLTTMPNPYVVKVVDLPAGPTVVCSSEGYGPVIAIDPATWNVRTIADGPGGCLDVTPVPGHNAVYMIGGSFVGYDFHRSGVYRLDIPDPGSPDPGSPEVPGVPIRLFDLPFAHRLQSFQNEDGVHLVAATIAQSKRDRDDWSRPGAVYVADLEDGLVVPERGAEPPTPEARAGIPGVIPFPLRPILGELHKNHGLTTVRNGAAAGSSEAAGNSDAAGSSNAAGSNNAAADAAGSSNAAVGAAAGAAVGSNAAGSSAAAGRLYISGTEGTFCASFPATSASLWEFERVFDHEISELFFIDLDGDGIDELVTIEPFHGDRLAVYRLNEGRHLPADALSGGAVPEVALPRGTRSSGPPSVGSRETTYSAPPALTLWLEKEIAFGHGLWTGMIGGVPSILVGNRSGHKNLEMIRVSEGRLVTETIAEGTGTAQVAVVSGGKAGHPEGPNGPDYIIASNQEQDEIVRYTIEHR